MWIDEGDSNRIESQTTLESVSLPPDIGDGFARLYGSDDRPETAAEWVADMREAIERAHGRSPTVDDLCTTEDGDHAFIGDDSAQTYLCVLDPLVYPFLTGQTGAVLSRTPVRGSEVTFGVGSDGPTVSHDDALVSIGVSDDVERTDEVSIEEVYRGVCGYIQTFVDNEEYETWAAEVDAATTAVPAEEGIMITRGLAVTLFGADTSAGDDASEDSEAGECCPDSVCC